jgi:outer membrane protein TolC
MRVERKVAARTWRAAMLIPVLAVSVSGQAAPSSAQDAPRGTITAALTQTPPAGQTPPPQTPPPTVSPTAPLATGEKPPTGDETAVIQEERTNGPTRSVTLDEAVALALENNLSVKIQKIQPAVSDILIQAARSAWLPALTGDMNFTQTDSPITNATQGASSGTQTTKNFNGSVGVQHALPFAGTQYTASWDASRSKFNTSSFSAYNPTLRSNLALNITQPLLRNFKIDVSRATYYVSKNNRVIADVQLHQQIVVTTAQVRQAYWDLVYARQNLRVLQQSLDLARQTLKDNRTRVEVGTMAPIDIVEAQAEVARNEQLVIGAAAQIDQNEDALRALIFNQGTPEFWNMNLDTSDQPDIPASTAPVDIEGAVHNAMQKRTDLLQLRKNLESSEINLRYYKNQVMPAVNGIVNYGATAAGGLGQTTRDPITNEPITLPSLGFSKVQSTLFGLDFPVWTLGVQVTYPLGTSNQKAQYARYRLVYDSDKLSLQNQELTASTQVRNAGRTLNTNRRQVEAARVSRELFERRLEAAQKKFAVGLATNFEVLQAQRDLADARNQELNAVVSYVKSRVTFEQVQEVGTGTGTGSTGSTGSSTGTGSTGTGSTGTTGTGTTGTGTNR